MLVNLLYRHRFLYYSRMAAKRVSERVNKLQQVQMEKKGNVKWHEGNKTATSGDEKCQLISGDLSNLTVKMKITFQEGKDDNIVSL